MIAQTSIANRINGTDDRALNGGHSVPVVAPDRISPGAPAEGAPFQFSAVLASARRCWKIAIPLGICLAAVGAFAGWKLLEPRYTATAFLRIDSDDRPLIFETADQANANVMNFRLYKNTQQQLMVAPFVINAALRDEEVARSPQIQMQSDPVTWLTESIKVEFPGDGEIMQVSLESDSGSHCVTLLNAVVNSYMDEVVVDERNERLQRLDNLERVYSEAEGKVRNKQAELKTLATSLGTGDSESLTIVQQSALQQFGVMQEKLSDVRFRLMEAEGDLSIAKELKKQMKAAEDANLKTPRVRNEAARNRIYRLEEEIAVVEGKMSSMLNSFGPGHPNVKTLAQQIEVKRDLLKQEREQERIEAARPAAKEPELDRQLGFETRVKILKDQEKILQAEVDRLAGETRQLGRSSIDVELMRSEIIGLEDVLRRVGEEIERTSIELKTASRIKLISPAEKATPPKNLKRIAFSAALSGMAFFLPLFVLVGFDVRRGKVDDLESVHATLPLSTLGAIPMVSNRTLQVKGMIAPQKNVREKALLTESVDSLAAMMLHLAESGQRKVVMISSAMEAEGKTTVALQLAESIARSGISVALVDLDLRRPSIHTRLDLEQSPGVAEILQDEVEWHDALHKMDDLCVLTAGEFDGNLQERAVRGAVAELFFNLRRQFDIVIVDGCPVLPVVDARVVSTYCDGVVLTLRRDTSRLPMVMEACEILNSYGVELLGTVVIGAKPIGYLRDSYYRRPYVES